MKAHLMFTAMTPATSQAITGWLRTTEKQVFQSALASLAAQRKLRPVYMARKTPAEQITWMAEQLKAKINEPVGENLLQIWLMKGRSAMLVTRSGHEKRYRELNTSELRFGLPVQFVRGQ